MIKALVISITVTPVIYLLIALFLCFLPVKRSASINSLDFDVLKSRNLSASSVIEDDYTPRDGSKLFYRYVPGSTRKVLVLLHGSGSEGRYLIDLAQRLSTTTGVHVIIPDLRGHGRSILSKPGDIDYIGQFEDDLHDLNDYLRSIFPDAKIILGGHSSGGGLAVKYGGKNRDLPFDAYLLLTPYLGYKAPTVKPNSGGWVQVLKRRYAGLAMLNNIGITHLNNLPVIFFNRPAQWKDSLQVDSYSFRLNESFSPQRFSENLKYNKQPILVLAGMDDEAFYPKQFESVFARYAPQASVQLIEGVRHLDLPDSEIAFAEITEWFDQL